MLTCETTISTICRLFTLISLYMWMSQDVTKESVSGEQAGPRLAWPLFRSHDFIVSVGIRSYLPVHKMASS
jgi:hypothetical protein